MKLRIKKIYKSYTVKISGFKQERMEGNKHVSFKNQDILLSDFGRKINNRRLKIRKTKIDNIRESAESQI